MCWLGFGLAFLGLGFTFFKPEPRYMALAWPRLGLAQAMAYGKKHGLALVWPWLRPWLALEEVNNNIKIT